MERGRLLRRAVRLGRWWRRRIRHADALNDGHVARADSVEAEVALVLVEHSEGGAPAEDPHAASLTLPPVGTTATPRSRNLRRRESRWSPTAPPEARG
jgi:hypothetical protein